MRRSVVTHNTLALLTRKTNYRESDLILSMFTESLGMLSAIARGARRSSKRFAGSLEPFHTLSVMLEEHDNHELLILRESRLAMPRRTLSGNLDAMQSAGRALRWLRDASPPHTPEPRLFQRTCELLDRLDTTALANPELALAEFGFQLLEALGWGLDFRCCVRTGKPCPPGKPATIDPARGGLVSREAGGGPIVLPAPQRERLAAAGDGQSGALHAEDVALALDLIEQALKAHAGMRH